MGRILSSPLLHENVVTETTINAADRLSAMCGLDELPPEKELSDAIDRLPNGKAVESDGISPEIMSQACAANTTPRIYMSVPGGGHSA